MGDPVAGSQIFLDQGCGACHRLAAAGATGTVGPNLDQSTRTLDEVVSRVAEGKAPMPTYAGRLTSQEIADVAAFVVAARGAGPTLDTPAGAPTPAEVRTIDLSPLIAAWNDGDLEALQALYAENALLASVDDVAAIQRGEALPTSIDNGAFQYQQAALGGMRLRILGEPIAVADKTAGFTFRLEGDDSGRDGVALLRYEGGKIWLHIYALDPQLTPNPPAGTSKLEPVSVDDLNATWTAVDLPAVASMYQEAAKVWRDEDLVSILTGSGAPLMSLEEQVRSRGPWGPAAVGDPVQIGNLVLFPWRWEAYDYPNGYGVRLLQYEGSRIATDVRFALRPWEVQGGTFLEGY
jgi:cytochrome c553